MTTPTSVPTAQTQPPKDAKPAGTRLGFSNYLGLLGALLAMIALFSVLSSHFLTYDTFSTIANQIPDLVVMAVGMTSVLIIAGIDLPVASVLALGASVVSVVALKWHWPPLPAALLGVAAAALTGTLTGAITVGWRIPSFIVSLGVLEAARGMAYQMTNSRTAYIGDAFDLLSNPIALGISPAFLIAVAVIVFALMGALAGLAALFQISRLEAADPNAGVGVELLVIAAVVIGGTSLMGGRGSVISTFFGVLIISVLAAGLAQIGANEPTKRIITGAVIVVAVVVDTYRSHRAKRRA